MPLWPLIVTLAAQTLATMARFSLPAIAPAMASALGVPGELVGLFVSVAYGTGIVSALLSPPLRRRADDAGDAAQRCRDGADCCPWQRQSARHLRSGIEFRLQCRRAGQHAPARARTPRAALNTVMSLR
jgi:hypothetical protein